MPDVRFLQHFSPAPAAGSGAIQPGELGFGAWSDAPGSCTTSGAVAAAAGVLALRRFSMPGPMLVQNVHIILSTAAVTPVANQCFVGVWDANGVLIGLSGDQSGNFGGVGLLTATLTPGPAGNGIDTPFVYAGLWYQAATGPFLIRCVTADIALLNGVVQVPVQTARAVTANTGLTVASSVPTQLGALTKNPSLNGAFWAAVS